MWCVNAGFDHRHPDAFPPKLRGYEQKRYRGPGISEVSRPVTYETVPDRTHGRWRACAVFSIRLKAGSSNHAEYRVGAVAPNQPPPAVHVLIWGDLQAYP
jgi:hypothetical protein